MTPQLVEVQLVLGLEGADCLQGVDLGAEGANHGGLACALAARNDDALASPHRRPKERGGYGCQHLPFDEIVKGDLHQPVAADDYRRPRRHPRRGGEAGASSRRRCNLGWASEKP